MTDHLQKPDTLFDRVAAILEQARSHVVKSVNSNLIIAYWLIGREIVEALQGGNERAKYGKQVIEALSKQLTQKYKKGFSATNLWYFKQFYQTYQKRLRIPHPAGGESDKTSITNQNSLESLSNLKKFHPQSGELKISFHPNLSWSHYRALLRVNNKDARTFYETEAAECGWSKAQLERQIQSSYYERILKKKGKEGLLPANRDRLPGDSLEYVHLLKAPLVYFMVLIKRRFHNA